MSDTDSQFVVAVALGPVGGFIAGGRRSRDLWYGSRLLSELTHKAVAILLARPGTVLLIPAPSGLKDFWSKPHRGPVIPNKILARVAAKDGAAVQALVSEARQKVLEFLAGEVGKLPPSWLDLIGIDQGALAAQGDAIRNGDFVEFYAAWAPVGADEVAAIGRVRDTLLAGRKAARVFPAPIWTKPGRPKCSLDPGRDSVMVEPDPTAVSADLNGRLMIAETLLQRMEVGIRRDERLDAIGLLRRHAAFAESRCGTVKLPKLQFPPLTRVAADPWLAGAKAVAARDLAEAIKVLSDLDTEGDLNPLFLISSPCREPGMEANEEGPCPYDPAPLFENGIQTLLREVEHPRLNPGRLLEDRAPPLAAMRRAAVTALNRLKTPVRRLHQHLGYPSPYYAMLEADGDDMGHILGQLTGEVRTRTVEALGVFAKDAWHVVEAHHGFAFYIGGDELVAYVPVDKVLPLVKALADLFKRTVGMEPLGPKGRVPTLSAGVVLAHQKEDMRAVRDWASAALSAAKQRRRESDAQRPAGKPVHCGWLCVEERPAGGVGRRSLGRIDLLIKRQGQWRDLIVSLGNDRDLSLSTAHDLLAWAERFSVAPHDPGARDADDRVGITLAHASVVQKLTRRDKKVPDPWLCACICEANTWGKVRHLANEVLLADRIADVSAQRMPARGRTQ